MPIVHTPNGSRHSRVRRIALVTALAVAACVIVWIVVQMGFVYVTLD